MSTPGFEAGDLLDSIRNSSRSDDMESHPDTWSSWFDVDTPTPGYNNGDYETVYRIQRTNKICDKDYEIAAAECYYNGDPQKTFTEDTPRDLVKDDLQRFCTTEGLICRNKDQYSGDICQDYSIRFRCHYKEDKDNDGSYPQFDVRIYIILAVVPILIFLIRMLWTYVCRRRRHQRRNERRARQRLNRDDIDDDSSSVVSGAANPPPSYQDLFGKTGHGTSGSSVFAISRENIPICRKCQLDSCSVASIIGKQRSLQNATAIGQSVTNGNDAELERQLQTQPSEVIDPSEQEQTESSNENLQQHREAENDSENNRHDLTGADVAVSNSLSASLDAAISFSAPTEIPCLPSAPVEENYPHSSLKEGTSSLSAPAGEPISSISKREHSSASFPTEGLLSESVPTEELSSSAVAKEELSSSSGQAEEHNSPSFSTEELISPSALTEEPSLPSVPKEELSSSPVPTEVSISSPALTEEPGLSPLAIESSSLQSAQNETPSSPSPLRETLNSPSKLPQDSLATPTKAPGSLLTSPESHISHLTPIDTSIPSSSTDVPISPSISTEVSNSPLDTTRMLNSPVPTIQVSKSPSTHSEASNSPSAYIESPNSQATLIQETTSTFTNTPNSPSPSLEATGSPVASKALQEVIIDIPVATDSSLSEAVLNQTSFDDTSSDENSALHPNNVQEGSIPDQINPPNGDSETLEASASQSTSLASSLDLTLSLNPSLLNPGDISEPCACPCHRTIPLKQQGAAGYDNEGYTFEGDVEANRHPSFPGMHIPVFGFHRVWSDASVASSVAQADLPTYDLAIELMKEKKTKEAESQTRSN